MSLGPLRFLPAVNPSRINHKGSILMIVLWSLCLLTTFAVHLGFGVRQKIIMVQRIDARKRLHFIADAGVKKAILELKRKEKEHNFDALTESWSNNPAAFKKVRVGGGKFTVSYAYFDSLSGERPSIRYGIVDEERKINVNKVKRGILERLFKTVGLGERQAQNLSAAIVDWRDDDSQLSIPLGSAEDRYYRSLKHPYEAKDAEFEVLDELLLVRGMNREIFAKIKDFITIYGEGKVNVNTASPAVLSSLGLDKAVVAKILFFRKGIDLIEATHDDNVFHQPANIVAELSQFCSLSDSEVANLSNSVSAGNLVTNSCNFTINSTAKLDNKDRSLKIVCVFERPADDSEEGEKIRYWREKPK